jgi:N-acetylneuraminic acid mutarotase
MTYIRPLLVAAALGLALGACNDREESPTGPSDTPAPAERAGSVACVYSDDQSTHTRTVTAACGNAHVAVPLGWSLHVQRSSTIDSKLQPRPAASSLASTMALAFTNPDQDYLSKTIKIDIGSLAELSTTTSVSNGQQTVLFDIPLQRLQVPESWSTWSSPPESEAETPPILFTQNQNSLSITLTQSASIVGFELEPNTLEPFTFTADFFSGTQLVGSVARMVDGNAGAGLMAALSTTLPIDHVTVSSAEDPSGFSIAQLRYSPWGGRTSMPAARRGIAVAAANRLIYAMGGINNAGSVVKTVQAYSAANNSWTTKAALPAARQTGNGAVAISGIIYLPGGHDATKALTKTLYAYNTSTNVWSSKAAMPAFSSCGGSAVISGKIYVYSGCTKSSTGSQIAATALHRYDPATNTWATLHAAPVSHFQPVVGAIAGKLYVVGGNNSSNVAFGRVDMYDPATNAWTSKAAMPSPRVGAAGSTINGKFQVIGGRNGTTYLNTVEAFDPAANSWATRPSMPTARGALGVGGLSGFLYAIGGGNSSGALATNERYTP